MGVYNVRMKGIIYMDYDNKGSNDRIMKELDVGLMFMYSMMTIYTSLGWFVSNSMNLSEDD